MINQKVNVLHAEWTVTGFLGKGKSAYSWKIERPGHRPLVYKKMHQEHVDYYTFGNKLMAEVEAYQRLEPSKAPIPRLLEYSDEEQYLVKEYLEGPTAAELAGRGELTLEHHRQAFALHGALKRSGLHVDYFPTNFIWMEGKFWLIDYECHPYDREWDLPNWGFFYWLNSQGIQEHLTLGQSENLNLPGRPKPVFEGFLAQRDQILSDLGLEKEPHPLEICTK